MVAARIDHLVSEEVAHLQHSKKFVEEEGTAEVRQTPVITGDAQVSGRSAHSEPYLTKSEVRLRLPEVRSTPLETGLWALSEDCECAGFRFEHVAHYNTLTSSVEMHLRSRQRQTAGFADFRVTFEDAETIWTENCHKYRLDEIAMLARAASFELDAQWLDAEWPFAETLLAVA